MVVVNVVTVELFQHYPKFTFTTGSVCEGDIGPKMPKRRDFKTFSQFFLKVFVDNPPQARILRSSNVSLTPLCYCFLMMPRSRIGTAIVACDCSFIALIACVVFDLHPDPIPGIWTV